MSDEPVRPTISIDILNQVDIRVGTIEVVEDVEGSDKLVKMRVNFGGFALTILAGMKLERANPLEIEGRQALFVVNLEPRKMRGVVSEGMLFDIGFADGIRPVLAVPEERVLNGSRAG
jgi:tRNA-binding protein